MNSRSRQQLTVLSPKAILSLLLLTAFFSFNSITTKAQPDGEKLFKINCASCHKPHKKLTGPALKGALDREIRIEIDPYPAAARGLSMRDIESALRRQNTNISAGSIAQGKRDYTYRTVGEYRNVAEQDKNQFP